MTQEAKHHKFAVKNKQQMAVSECLRRISDKCKNIFLLLRSRDILQFSLFENFLLI